MDYDRLSDDQLLALIARQDANALDVLYDRYAPAVLAVATMVLGSSHRAEDLVAEIFYELWNRRGRLTVQGSSFRNRLMLYTRRMALEISARFPP
jgi:RNA polymerase sigma-70 factor (ECF subfamily)